jgi:hypothetical protein
VCSLWSHPPSACISWQHVKSCSSSKNYSISVQEKCVTTWKLTTSPQHNDVLRNGAINCRKRPFCNSQLHENTEFRSCYMWSMSIRERDREREIRSSTRVTRSGVEATGSAWQTKISRSRSSSDGSGIWLGSYAGLAGLISPIPNQVLVRHQHKLSILCMFLNSHNTEKIEPF